MKKTKVRVLTALLAGFFALSASPVLADTKVSAGKTYKAEDGRIVIPDQPGAATITLE